MRKIKRNSAKKTFVVIFEALNEHLTKDVGSIPYVLARDYGYDSYLVCHDIGQKFSNEYALQFLKIIKLKPIKHLQSDNFRKFYFISYLYFLLRNAKNIDIMQFYHNSMVSNAMAFAYKTLNPNGFVYLKLDSNGIASGKETKNTYLKIVRSLRKTVKKIFKKSFDLISVETKKVYDNLKEHSPEWEGKLIHIPNGVDFELLKSLGFEHPQETAKEKVIITVARIGLKYKNNRMMLDALNGLDLKGWKFVFIGPVEHSFESEIENFYSLNPQLKESVIFTGAINDRKVLYSWYKKAKAFCLTSTYEKSSLPCENFSLAMTDSLYFGCEIISTPIVCFDDLTNQNEFGYSVGNADGLRDILEKIITGEINLPANMDKIIKYGNSFSWRDICKKIHTEINLRI